MSGFFIPQLKSQNLYIDFQFRAFTLGKATYGVVCSIIVFCIYIGRVFYNLSVLSSDFRTVTAEDNTIKNTSLENLDFLPIFHINLEDKFDALLPSS